MSAAPRALPIVFSAPMARALLDGRKTQTRRVLNPQPEMRPGVNPNFSQLAAHRTVGGRWQVCGSEPASAPFKVRYSVGDVLWVREPFQVQQIMTRWALVRGQSKVLLNVCVDYSADGRRTWLTGPASTCPKVLKRRINRRDGTARMIAARYMPRLLNRLTLVVTDVRVDRVARISEADAIAEGMVRSDPSPQFAYRSLWDSLNAKRGFGWDTNPWVVAITFTVHRQNVDAFFEGGRAGHRKQEAGGAKGATGTEKQEAGRGEAPTGKQG